MMDKFEAFIKNKLEEGVAPSLSSLSVIKLAAKENSKTRRPSSRVRFLFVGLVAAVLSAIIALTVLFQFKDVDSREIARASKSKSKSKSISHSDNVTVQIIELLSVDDIENQEFAHISSDIDRLLSWQDVPYNEIAYEYSNQF